MKQNAYAICLTIAATIMSGCLVKKTQVVDPTQVKSYVEAAHKPANEQKLNEGSLWTTNNFRSDLFRDPKARFVNDVVTIVVSESTQAAATADAKNKKSTSMSAGFTNFAGLEKKIKELPNLVNGTTGSTFEGSGATTRATTLETTLTARVVDVLPNGYLVVEGMREVHINNENQMVILNGVIRPDDVSSGNQVLSSAVAQMSVKVQGKGLASSQIKPGWLYKILMGVLPF